MQQIEEKNYTINGITSPLHMTYCTVDMNRINTYTPFVHHHKYIEFLYSINSKATISINAKEYPFNTGDLVMINRGEVHDFTAFAEPSQYIVIKFYPEIIYSSINTMFEHKYLLPFVINTNHTKRLTKEELKDTVIPSLILESMKEWDEQAYAHELFVRSNIIKIYAIILRLLNFDMKSPNNQYLISNDMTNALIYINENFSTVKIEDAAKISHLSYTYFSTKFKQLTNLSFNDYVMSLKITHAEHLLITTNKSITTIAFECGFSSSSHFIRTFREKKGVTPLVYKKNILCQ